MDTGACVYACAKTHNKEAEGGERGGRDEEEEEKVEIARLWKRGATLRKRDIQMKS